MIKIDYVSKLYPVLTKSKRIKIIVGGRGSTKSTGIADYVASKMYNGELWCCARENQNSIEESVHRTILDEISRLGLDGFEDTKTSIKHESGGRSFYRGLARNITSLKSTLSGVDGLWIEEGEDISENTLRVLTASVRLNAKDTEKLIGDKDIKSIDDLEKLLIDSNIKMPEIIITMNRGARTGAVAQKWLSRAEKELKRCGYYEDDLIMVVEMNYTDMPKKWFIASGLEQERLDDKEKLTVAAYESKWLSGYLDEVENSIIKPEWFDAAIDAHKIDRLKEVFKPMGAKIAAHDPFDDGGDSAGFVLRHGSIVTHVKEKKTGEIDECCDWATNLAKNLGVDMFVWDGDGMGTGLKRQVSINLDGTKTDYQIFKGSLSGIGQDNAEQIYQDDFGNKKSNKTFAESFKNNRAQYYIKLKDRIYNTYLCVVKNKYIATDDMISFDSDGIESMDLLRSELCRIPLKNNNNGLLQIMSKQEMKSNGIQSPNLADSVMMSMINPVKKKQFKKIQYRNKVRVA